MLSKFLNLFRVPTLTKEIAVAIAISLASQRFHLLMANLKENRRKNNKYIHSEANYLSGEDVGVSIEELLEQIYDDMKLNVSITRIQSQSFVALSRFIEFETDYFRELETYQNEISEERIEMEKKYDEAINTGSDNAKVEGKRFDYGAQFRGALRKKRSFKSKIPNPYPKLTNILINTTLKDIKGTFDYHSFVDEEQKRILQGLGRSW